MSTIPITGIPNVLASLTAIFSWPTSIINKASGRERISLIPPRPFSSFSSSRVIISASFLPPRLIVPSACIFSISCKRRTDCLIVLKLVSMPPSQRWSTKGILQRCASSLIAFCAARFVPTNIILPPLAAIEPAKFNTSLNMGSVFSRFII